MELDSIQRINLMLQTHNNPIATPCGDNKIFRLGLYAERMIASGPERRRQPFEYPNTAVINEILFAMHGDRSMNSATSENFIYGLHPKTYTQNGNFIKETTDYVLTDASLGRVLGSRRNANPFRTSLENFINCNFVMTENLNRYTKGSE
jgi:hypothetical protein